MNLFSLREGLADQNHKLINSIIQRRTLVEEIQKEKRLQGFGEELFDPDQEWKIFKAQRIIFQNLTLNELYAFSFIAEGQVRAVGQYPKWSEAVHIENPQGILVEKVNPILLSQVKPDLIIDLKFSQEYALLHKFIQEKIMGQS